MDDVKQIIPQLTVLIWLLVLLINVDLVFHFEHSLSTEILPKNPGLGFVHQLRNRRGAQPKDYVSA